MKLLLALAALAPLSASAEPSFWCKDTKAGPDHGYYANFNASMQYVDISMQSIAGPQKLAELNCSYTAIPEGQAADGKPYLRCTEPKLRDAGYSLTLARSDGKLVAKLFQVSFAGSENIATLVCGRR